jgi:uridine phosphorylase
MVTKGSFFEGIQPHIKCKRGDVAKYALIPGDVDRAEKIVAQLDEAKFISKNREYIVYTGSKDGVPITVCTTGIGAPSTAIAVEELGKIGVEVFIRVGSAGGLQPDINTGEIVILTGAYRAEGTSNRYVPTPYPAIADIDVVNALRKAADSLKIKVNVGLGIAEDAFYGTPEQDFMNFYEWKIKAIEMEASAIFVIASLRGWKSGTIDAIDGNPAFGTTKEEKNEALFRKAEKDEITIAIEAIKLLDKLNK